MKSKLSIVVVCLALTASGLAAGKKAKKQPTGHPTVPPTSPMIVLPKVPEATGKSSEPGGLITTDLSGRDLQFFTTALESGRVQAYLVDQVKTKGESESIKAIGAALAATQSEENKQIARLASLKGLTVPTDPPDGLQKIGADLDKLSGSNFDKAAMDGIIAAGRQSMGAYEMAAQSSDGDIKAFSEQMLPIAKEKLRVTEKMTGAGSKTAGQLFRTGAPVKAATPSGPPAASPAKPVASPAKPGASPAKAATPAATPTAFTPRPAGTPATPTAFTPKPATPAAMPTAFPPKPAMSAATPPPLTVRPAALATPAKPPAATPSAGATPRTPIPPPITK